MEVTDDAQALELAGYAPKLVEGSADNIKITTPADLRLAEMIWLNQRNQ
jgi:2-C-methyl-D-erythritol 4-phosphate cytidylyltransferase